MLRGRSNLFQSNLCAFMDQKETRTTKGDQVDVFHAYILAPFHHSIIAILFETMKVNPNGDNFTPAKA